MAKEDGIGRGHPYSNEKPAPILAFYTSPSYVEICELCQEILHYEGAGFDTFSMHTKDEKMVDYFATRIPASRIIVNTPSALGGIGGTTAPQALTLGCGAIGGSATSENVGPKHLMNLRYVAEGIREIEDVKADPGLFQWNLQTKETR